MAPKTKWKYGQLNSIEKSKFTRRLEVNSDNYLSTARYAVRDVLYKQKLDLDGEFVGIVLSTWSDNSKLDSDSISFVSRIWNSLGIFDDRPPIIQAKVRVPEVHATIPEPENSKDKKKIDLHTTFAAVTNQINKSELNPEDLVVVRFFDSSGMFNPQILRVLAPGPKNSTFAEESGNPRDSVEGESDLDVIVASGDTIGSGKKSNNQSAYGFVGPTQELPGAKNHIGKTIVEILPSTPYKQNRVRVHEGISRIPSNSSLLTNVATRPGWPQQKLHKLVAERFETMREDASFEGIDIYVQSGWRSHRWDSREQYEEKMIQTYGSVSKGELAVAYISAHETGLAADFYIPADDEDDIDIAPSQRGDGEYGSRTDSQQKKTKAFKWLRNNAHKYGFTPYINEAWHWEVLLPIEAWKSGAEVAKDYDITNYDIRVKETSVANGSRTNQRNFTFE